MNNQDILLTIDGMGIVIYSNEALKNIEEGLYHVSVLTSKSINGKIGDNQDVYVFF